MQPKLILSAQSPASDSQVTGLQVCVAMPSNPPPLKVRLANFFFACLLFTFLVWEDCLGFEGVEVCVLP